MSADTHIHLVRHGHVHNPENLFYGRRPRFRLSSLGVAQARQAARFFANRPLAVVYASPMLRARQTACELLKMSQLSRIKISGLINHCS